MFSFSSPLVLDMAFSLGRFGLPAGIRSEQQAY